MASPADQSVTEVASVLHVSAGTVRRWIRAGRVLAVREGQELRIPIGQNFLVERLHHAFASSNRHPYTPTALRTYAGWHNTLDELVWLLKVAYTSPYDLKKRRFRLDSLFAAYIRTNRLAIPAMRRALASPSARRWRLVEDDLKRGWSNPGHISRADNPVGPAGLGVGNSRLKGRQVAVDIGYQGDQHE